MGEPYSGNVTPRAQLAQDTAAGPVVQTIQLVSFPLMLDRHAGAGDAMVTSLRAVARNPVPMASRHRSLIVPRMRCNTQYCFADPGSRWSMASVTVAALRRTAEEALHRVRDTTGTSEALF
jgi:hypothetical protein